jgi:hypothetical protein
MTEQQNKPIVHYIASPHDYIVLGHRGVVRPVDHYATERVSNTREVLTSTVMRVQRSDGVVSEFETRNTIYRPQEAV